MPLGADVGACDIREVQLGPDQVADEKRQVVLVGNIAVDRGQKNMDLADRPIAKSYAGHSESPDSSFIRQFYNLLGQAFLYFIHAIPLLSPTFARAGGPARC